MASPTNGGDAADQAGAQPNFSPEASPVPIIALPISRMTARTSAKFGQCRQAQINALSSVTLALAVL